MIGRYQVDCAIAKSVPKELAISPSAYRGSAFGECVAVFDLLRREVKVMRAGLDGDRQTFRASRPQVRESHCSGQMHDVQPKSVHAAEMNHQPDRFELRLVRA